MSDGGNLSLYIAHVHTGKDARGKQLPYMEDERDVKDTVHVCSQLGSQVPFLMGAWHAMAANSSLRSVGSLLPTWVALGDFGDSFLVDIHISDHNAIPKLDSRQVVSVSLGSSRAQWLGQVIMSISTNPWNKEHMSETFCRAKFKFPGP